MKARAVLAAVLFGGLPGAAQELPPVTRIDSVFAAVGRTNAPGCALGVVRDGQLVLARGYGMANLDYGIAITPGSVFRIASVSKQFTAAVAVLLAEEGIVSLDDDIRRHLPEMPRYERPITIRQLLHHTSGLRDYLTLMTLAGKREDDWYTDADVLAMLARQQALNFAPGDEFLYSNSGYFVISQIVRRTTGRTLREEAQRRIFGPLGMGRTHFHDNHREVTPNLAVGYRPAGGGFEADMTTLDMVGDGGVFTTVEDLARWAATFDRPHSALPALPQALLVRGILTNGDTIDYALGLRHGTYRGLPTIGHGGAFVGYRSEFLRFPSERLTIVCLCNFSTAQPAVLARRVADIVLDGRLGPPDMPPERAARAAADTAPLPQPAPREHARYAGVYESDELGVRYRVESRGDSLRLLVGNELDGTLVPAGDERFRRGNLVLRFDRRGGRVIGFRLDAGRVRGLGFRRTAP